MQLKISPYPSIPAESIVVRDNRYPSTLMLSLNGFMSSKVKGMQIVIT